MKKRMPTSHQTHVYDKRAFKNLEENFPEHWKISKTTEIYSGIEYGDDWLCEIVDEENNVTGMRFYIQSKSTEKKLSKSARRLSMPLKVSTLNRLHVLNLPVMIHYYHKPSNLGFWMWLDPYYQKEYKPSWEQKEKVPIYVPTKCILNAAAINAIISEVNKFHKIHHLQSQIAIANETDEDFHYKFETDGTFTRVGIFPKHPGSLNKITFNVALNDANAELLNHFIELGSTAQFESMISIEGLPPWLTENLEGKSEVIFMNNIAQSQEPSHLQFEYLDNNGNSLFKSKLVEMKLEQAGTKYQRYEGKGRIDPIIFTVEFDAIKPQTKLNVGYNPEFRNVQSLDWYYDFLSKISTAKTAKLYNLDTDDNYLLENYAPLRLSHDTDPDSKEFVKNLALISTKLKTQVLIPQKTVIVANEDVLTAQGVAEALTTGTTYGLSNIPSNILQSGDKPIMGLNIPISIAREIDTDIRSEGYAIIPLKISEQAKILDYWFDLGPGTYHVCCTEIHNLKDLQKSINTSDDNLTLLLELVVDVSRSYMEFENWKPISN